MWWCNYCFCGGQGIGSVDNPYFGAEAKELCIHSKTWCVEFDGPFCGGMAIECCITSQIALPPIAGSPMIVCCNKECKAGKSGSWSPQLFDYNASWSHNWWLYYCFCMGAGCHKPFANDRPIFAVDEKFFCIRSQAKCEQPIIDGVWCSQLGTTLCFWNQCEFPPMKGNPFLACCGFPKTGAKFCGYGKSWFGGN